MRALLIVTLFIAGCSLTPTQKKWIGFAAGAIVVGTIAAHDDSDEPLVLASSGGVGAPSVPCRPQPDGSCR